MTYETVFTSKRFNLSIKRTEFVVSFDTVHAGVGC